MKGKRKDGVRKEIINQEMIGKRKDGERKVGGKRKIRLPVGLCYTEWIVIFTMSIYIGSVLHALGLHACLPFFLLYYMQ